MVHVVWGELFVTFMLHSSENSIKNLSKHVIENIYMNSDKLIDATFEFDKSVLNDVIDWFGKDIILKEKDDKTIKALVTVNPVAMEYRE